MTKSEIIQAARDILGNLEDNASSQRFIPDEAILPALTPLIRRLNRRRGASSAMQEVTFSTVPDQQDYSVAGVVGDNVNAITDVVRSGAYDPEHILNPGGIVDPRTGIPVTGTGFIAVGYQGEVIELMTHLHRARVEDKYSWEEVLIDSVRTLRLMPAPQIIETVVVRFSTTSEAIATLPEECRTAMTYGACVAIADGILNRLHRDVNPRLEIEPRGEDRARALSMQRDRYQDLLDAEMLELGA